MPTRDHPHRRGRAARAAGPRQADDDRIPDPAVADAAHRIEEANDPGARRGAVHPERDRALAREPQLALALDPERLLVRPRRERGTAAFRVHGRCLPGGPRSARAPRARWRGARRRAPRRASIRARCRARSASSTAAMKAASSPGATSRPLTPSATCSAAAAAANDTTGRPEASASMTTLPKVSVRLGNRNRSADA